MVDNDIAQIDTENVAPAPTTSVVSPETGSLDMQALIDKYRAFYEGLSSNLNSTLGIPDILGQGIPKSPLDGGSSQANALSDTPEQIKADAAAMAAAQANNPSAATPPPAGPTPPTPAASPTSLQNILALLKPKAAPSF